MLGRVVIVGGGLAGIAAAVRLQDAGIKITLLEARKRLGGRATSFHDTRSDLLLDNCQHVVLGCCTNLIDLYFRLGVADLIEWHRTLHWTTGGGVVDRMKAGWLPAPLHLAGSMRRMRIYSKEERKHIARAMWRMIRLGNKGRFAWTGRTFAEFLAGECAEPDAVVERFWNTVIVSACNLDVHRVSAATAIQVFQEGFLANRWSYTMGIPTVPLSDLYDAAVPLIEGSGGEVRLGAPARALAYDGTRMTGVVTDDGVVEAAAIVSAVPFDRLDRLVSEACRAADRRLEALDALNEIGTSPILGVHLFFETRVMTVPHLVLVGRDVQWLFDKGTGPDGVQHVHAVISGADAWMDEGEDEIVARVLADVHHALPRSRGLEPVAYRAIKERRATFAATPAFEARRPRAEPGWVGVSGGGIRNLFLAGDWCDTGWPATMEGAVRSGYAAAAAISEEGGVIEDVPAGWLARRLGLR